MEGKEGMPLTQQTLAATLGSAVKLWMRVVTIKFRNLSLIIVCGISSQTRPITHAAESLTATLGSAILSDSTGNKACKKKQVWFNLNHSLS